jgi:hypothetical protein
MKYEDYIKNKTNYVLLKGLDVIGTFGNLRKAINFITDDKHPSYWTLIRKQENPINFNEYKIFRVKHY